MPAPTAVFRYLFLFLPAAFLLTSGARLYAAIHERNDIWWPAARGAHHAGGRTAPAAGGGPRIVELKLERRA